MIKLFISDIDGCISEPYQAMNVIALKKLSDWALEGGAVKGGDVASIVPALSLCSGRPMPYVECLAQVLGIQMPVLFESGGGIFDPINARVHWSPHLTTEIQQQVREITRWLEKDCVPGTSMVVDYAKRAHAGVIGPDPDEIIAAIPKVKQFVADTGLGFDVLPTHLSVDIIPEGITKETGMKWLAAELALGLDEIAYIGDSLGDLKALTLVGHSFAPENAKDVVREGVGCVTSAGIQGVQDAFKMCMDRNRQTIEIEELNS